MSRDGRSSLILNPSFRAHLLWVVGGTTAALLVISSAVVMVPLLLRFDAAGASPDELERITDRILTMHTTLWPMVVICVASVIISSWVLYKRMVAPLVRFVQVFAAVRDGRLPGPIRLRGGDYLVPEANALNEMTSALRERHAALSASRAYLQAQSEEVAEWASLHGDADLARLVAELSDREKALADQVARIVAD
ncbi:MAG: methyl-accepting chemotaxis protein [Deltaproteobacteria bacterium]|nr:methyl-accepting chemotaxis protein [Deltaproteobacteria bacterium]